MAVGDKLGATALRHRMKMMLKLDISSQRVAEDSENVSFTDADASSAHVEIYNLDMTSPQ